MKKLTGREIAQRLAAHPTPEPPTGLADRIKAEIPGSIRLDRRVLQPGRRWLLPPLVEGLQPTWLAAASVLLVLGVGIVAARIPTQPDDIWKWMALSGVVHIDDIVVTAPAPREPEGTAVALAQAPAAMVARQRVAAAVKGAPQPEPADVLNRLQKDLGRPAEGAAGGAAAAAPAVVAGALEVNVSDGHDALPGASVTATRADAADAGVRSSVSDTSGRAVLSYLPPGEYRVRSELQGFQPLDTTVTVAAGARSKVDFAMPQSARSEAVTVTGSYGTISTAAHSATAVNRPEAARAPAPIADRENAVTVVVLDQAGEPLEGATVTLERIGQGAVWTRTARTEAAGSATFRGVPPSSYRALVTAPSIVPAQLVVSVTSERAPTRAEIHVRPPRRR